jgi:cell division ATPase FtsA
MKPWWSLVFVSVAMSQSAWSASIKPQKISEAMVYTLPGKTYEQVREDLTAAIEERGMVISAVSHVKDMIDRTSTDLGYKQGIYATGGETVLFCKADLSQAMMRDNVHNIALCPYGISVYTLAAEPNKVFVSYRIPPKMKVYLPIHRLLDDIVQSVAE